MTTTIGTARPLIALLALGLLTLAGCGSGTVQDALGMGKRAPDEFAVVARAPLVLPPDYELRPPRPGEPRPQTGTTSDQARARLLGQTAIPASNSVALDARPEPTPASAGQQALLTEAGGGAADPEIRRRIAEENQSLVQVEQALFTRVMKWREPNTLAATVDAPAEAERLRDARAKGEPPTTGDTPTVVERRQSPLGALVDRVF